MKKKLLKLTTATFLVATMAQAEMVLSVQGTNTDFMGEKATGAAISWGFEKTLESKIYTSITFDIDYADIKNEALVGYSGNLKLGYSLLKDLNIYAIGSALQQSYTTTAYGFRYGGGVSYDITKSIGLQAEYKTHAMTANSYEYDYSIATAGLKYSF
jgi:opacity protein-like surface antigen